MSPSLFRSRPVTSVWLLLAAGLAACSTPCNHEAATPLIYQEQVTPLASTNTKWLMVRHDEPLDQRVVVRGHAIPDDSEQPPPPPERCIVEDQGSIRLDSVIETTTGRVRHELRVVEAWTGTGWVFWQAARLSDDTALGFHALDRHVGECAQFSHAGCRHSETYAVDLADSLLRNRLNDGLTVETRAQSGTSHTIVLKPEQLKAQLAAVDALRPMLRPRR